MIEMYKEVAEFCGVSEKVVYDNAISKKRIGPNHNDLFNLLLPGTPEELNWFYRSNNMYIYSLCRRHKNLAAQTIAMKLPEHSKVLDYGGGIGNNSVYLAQKRKDIYIYMVEVNLIQIQFVRWLKVKYHLAHLQIFDANLLSEISRIYNNSIDLVILDDIIEHLFDYRPILKRMYRYLKTGGKLVEHSPFGHQDLSIHMKDKYNLPEYLKKLGFKSVERFVWEKL